MKGMRKIVTAAGWIVVSALSMLSAQPSPAQIENINLLAVMNRNFLDCLNFNP